MRVPFSWLGEYVELTETPEATAEMLTAAGMKVEKVIRMGEDLQGVVVGQVLKIDPHPNADRLALVEIETVDRRLRIVCGAKNFAVGDKVPVAVPGSRLPEMGLLEARRIRGVASEGMLCSATELGAGDDGSGILVLEPEVPVGSDVKDVLGMSEVVLDLEITPNRPDAMGLIGIAREVAACTGAKLIPFSLKPPTIEGETGGLRGVVVKDPAGCPRYLATVIVDVKAGPSPEIVQRRLALAGVRPISNLVDATNYALLITGHPMHAFDLDRLAEQTIIVRRASPGEKIKTIDGEDRTLDPDDLVIADASAPVALAGVMGGLGSEVTGETRRVALESAYFDPAAIFRSSKRHGLRTEASARFERGTDPNNVEFAANLAASLMLEWSGGRLEGATDFYPNPIEPRTIGMRPARANLLLGTALEPSEMTIALERLGLDAKTAEDRILVTVPTRRADLIAEEDLIEEVARATGFDRIPSTLPAGRRAGALPAGESLIRRAKSALAGSGLFEAKTSIFCSPLELEKLGMEGGVFRLSNALTVDESILRPSILPGLVRSVAGNFSRRNLEVRLFEVGSVFSLGGRAQEPLRLGIAMGGESPQQWHSGSRALDFYDLKGAVETVLDALGIADPTFESAEQPPLHPARTAQVAAGGEILGALGQLGPEASSRFDMPYPIYLAELDLGTLLAMAQVETPSAGRQSRFPAVFLDLAVSVLEEVNAADVLKTARAAGGPELESIRLIDVYRGEQAGEGRKSLAFSMVFRRADRTLAESEAILSRDAMAAAIAKDHGGRVR
ncbi:MAG: phenylalanine--tRNA ligase subunit beta [Actinomycetota bacterium]